MMLLYISAGWVAGWLAGGVAGPVIIVPLRGSILQAETCQILRLAENPRWSPSVAKLYDCTYFECILLGYFLIAS